MVSVIGASSAAMVTAIRTDSNKADADVAPPAAERAEGVAADPRPISLSPEAATVVLQEQNQPAIAAQPHIVWQTFITVRDGFSNYETAAGINDPNFVSNSAGLDDAQLMSDVRTRMDANIQKMADSGEAYGTHRFEGVDANSMLSGLDPRSLKLVRDSEGDTFNADEKLAARAILDMQEGTSGMRAVPTRLMPLYVAMGLDGRPADARRDMLTYLNGELRSQPQSVPNQISQASMRVLLGDAASNQLFGAVPPEDKMLTFLVDTLKQAKAKDPHVLEKASGVRDLDDLRKEDWFQPAIEKLNAVLDEQAKLHPANAADTGERVGST